MPPNDSIMKAAVIHATGVIRRPVADDSTIREYHDIILKVTSTAICGSNLPVY